MLYQIDFSYPLWSCIFLNSTGLITSPLDQTHSHFHALCIRQAARKRRPLLQVLFQILSDGKDIADVE